MNIAIRKFEKEDIPYKVKWINDQENNKYLHYELPLREDKTLDWFYTLKHRFNRCDFTITYNEEPVGLIGLINIDKDQKTAEYYVCLGGDKYKGKGIANIATDLIIKKAYEVYHLKILYLYTEVKNIGAQKMFEKSKFKKEKLLKNDLFYNNTYIDRLMYTLDVEKYITNGGASIIGNE